MLGNDEKAQHGHAPSQFGVLSVTIVLADGKQDDAGAPIVSIIGPDEVAIRMRHPERFALQELLDLVYTECDLVLVEGAKRSDYPMIEVVRGDPAVPGTPSHLLALVNAADDPRDLPRFDRDDIEGIAQFVEQQFLA